MMSLAERKRRWREKYPDRYKAQQAVFTNTKKGTLKKTPCFCGEIKVEAHHTDYTKPLDVTWLCKKHHVEADKQRRLIHS